MADSIKINRAPVLTLWSAVVAERLGYKRDEALTLGKALAGLNAQSKGQRLGIYSRSEEELEKKTSEKAKERKDGDSVMVEVVGRPIPAVQTKDGLRAAIKGEAIDPGSVERYLDKKFGENLADVRAVLESLAESYPPQELKRSAYGLYEQFRPSVPEGVRGWGAMGELSLDKIRKMAKKG